MIGLGRCADCRWWGSVVYAVPSRLGEWRLCEKSAAAALSCLPEDAAVYHDDLLTTDDFGCVQFEARGGDGAE